MSGSKSRWFFRVIFSVLGLSFCALGMKLSAKAALGTTSFASLPFVLDLLFVPTMGTFVTLLSVFYILLQICILRREFKPISFLQFAGSIILGRFVDLWDVVFRWLVFPNYPLRLLGLVIGIFILAMGITLAVEADLMAVPVDTFVSVVARKRGTTFGKVKVPHDIIYVSCTCLLSLLTLGELQGAREGTLLAALTMGRVADLYKPWVSPLVHKLCFGTPPLDKAYNSKVK